MFCYISSHETVKLDLDARLLFTFVLKKYIIHTYVHKLLKSTVICATSIFKDFVLSWYLL